MAKNCGHMPAFVMAILFFGVIVTLQMACTALAIHDAVHQKALHLSAHNDKRYFDSFVGENNIDDDDDDDDMNNNDVSEDFTSLSSSSSSSFSSLEKDDIMDDTFDEDNKMENLLNKKKAADTQATVAKGRCLKDTFERAGRCRPCSHCGPDLYIREACQAQRDTVCDWCLNPLAFRNADFRLKCSEIMRIQREFNRLIERRANSAASSSSSFLSFDTSKNNDNGDYSSWSSSSSSSSSSASSEENADSSLSSIHINVVKPIYVDNASSAEAQRVSSIEAATAALTNTLQSLRFMRFSTSSSWKLELLLEVCLYIVLIALLFVVIRFVSKSKPYYRTVNVHPPLLNETDNKNIIRAADEIREKLGKKGYNRLEEFI